MIHEQARGRRGPGQRGHRRFSTVGFIARRCRIRRLSGSRHFCNRRFFVRLSTAPECQEPRQFPEDFFMCVVREG